MADLPNQGQPGVSVTYPWLAVWMYNSWGRRLALLCTTDVRLSDVPRVEITLKQVENVRNRPPWRERTSSRSVRQVSGHRCRGRMTDGVYLGGCTSQAGQDRGTGPPPPGCPPVVHCSLSSITAAPSNYHTSYLELFNVQRRTVRFGQPNHGVRSVLGCP